MKIPLVGNKMSKRMNLDHIYTSETELNGDIRNIGNMIVSLQTRSGDPQQSLVYYIKNFTKLEKTLGKTLFYLSVANHNTPNKPSLQQSINKVINYWQILKKYQYSVIKKTLNKKIELNQQKLYISKFLRQHLIFIKKTDNFVPSSALLEYSLEYNRLMKNYTGFDEREIKDLENLLTAIKKEQINFFAPKTSHLNNNNILKYIGLSKNVVNKLTNFILTDNVVCREYISSNCKKVKKFNDIFGYTFFQKCTSKEVKMSVKNIFKDLFPEFSTTLEHFFQNSYIEIKKNRLLRGWHIGCPTLKQSRILLSSQNTVIDIFNLSHELGHAYSSYKQGMNHCYSVNLITIEFGAIFCELYSYSWYLEKHPKQQSRIQRLLVSRLLKYLLVPVEQYLFECDLFDSISKEEENINPYPILIKVLEAIYGQSVDQFDDINRRHVETSQYFSIQPFYSLSYLFAFFAAFYSVKKLKMDKNFIMRVKNVLANLGTMTIPDIYKMLGIDINSLTFYKEIIGDINAQIKQVS